MDPGRGTGRSVSLIITVTLVKYEGGSELGVHHQYWIEVEGMSDLSIYELEDIIWDDFDRSGDHIVPHPNKDDGCEDKSEGAICKKPRRDVTTPLQIKEESNPETLNKETQMMEKDSWGVFVASGDADSAKDMSTIQSGDAKISSNITSGSELCTDDGILKDNSAVGDNNSYNHPPSHNKLTLQPDLNLFSNDGDDKESSDLLYYGWPDIGNFDDMDRMLSNCDSSFGLGVTGNDDELVWFTSEDPAGGYEEPMKMELKFPCTETNTPPQNNGSQESDNKRSRIVSESKDEFKPKDNKGYMQNTTYLHPSGPMMSCTKFENKGPTCSSQKETSNESMASGSDPIPSQKKIESQNDIRGIKKGSSVGLGSLDVPEGSSISTELDEISLEATSFRQLQQVMEQLDLRTKLCIRDSLYRLARSAEQRHNNHAGISGPLLTDGTNNGFMDMETDTNPIDRTIAHLLFHRPSESFNMPTTSPLKPNAKERRNESDDKVSSSRKN
ncbi:unnamed protein product [Lactuca saligna]|uniref:Protein LNK1-like n=1 Tax=Lactuca saligna TaxID=75948 RepID=A0AA36EQ29_LACSI|nr:unnamed protein product [Lactuca saligna]